MFSSLGDQFTLFSMGFIDLRVSCTLYPLGSILSTIEVFSSNEYRICLCMTAGGILINCPFSANPSFSCVTGFQPGLLYWLCPWDLDFVGDESCMPLNCHTWTLPYRWCESALPLLSLQMAFESFDDVVSAIVWHLVSVVRYLELICCFCPLQKGIEIFENVFSTIVWHWISVVRFPELMPCCNNDSGFSCIAPFTIWAYSNWFVHVWN